MKMKKLALSRVYGLLETGPVVLMTTAMGDKKNVMTMSWHTMIDFTPPLIGVIISNRNFSFDLLQKTKECVIAIPSSSLARIAVKIGNTSGKKTDKFKKFGLTAIPASEVSAPLVGECFANIECKVVDDSMVEKYGLFVLEAVKAWIDPEEKDPRTIHHRGDGNFMIAGETIHLPSGKK